MNNSGSSNRLPQPTTSENILQHGLVAVIHHLILRRLAFAFLNAVCLGWLQNFPSQEVLSVKFLHECLTPAVSYGKVVKLHPFRENMLWKFTT
jgi:hypothetical protein